MSLPSTNALDHPRLKTPWRCCCPVESVMKMWKSGDLTTQFTKVWNRLQRVLLLIVGAKRDNTLVQQKCGKKFEGLKSITSPNAAAAQPEVVAYQEADGADIVDLVDVMKDEEEEEDVVGS